MGSEAGSQTPHERSGKGREEFSQVGTGSGQHHVDGIADQTFQEAATEAVFAFEVANLRFHRTAALLTFLLGSCQVAIRASGDVDRRLTFVVVAAIPFVDVDVGDGDAGVRFDRRDRLSQRVAIVRIPPAQLRTDDPVARLVVAIETF